jgi:hypothetical protein
METRYRASFVNSLGGFKSVVMIGSKNKKGQENLAIFNSLIHIGANPALCAFIVRPDVSPRHTLENIIESIAVWAEGIWDIQCSVFYDIQNDSD